jgi:hypothetical protein
MFRITEIYNLVDFVMFNFALFTFSVIFQNFCLSKSLKVE